MGAIAEHMPFKKAQLHGDHPTQHLDAICFLLQPFEAYASVYKINTNQYKVDSNPLEL